MSKEEIDREIAEVSEELKNPDLELEERMTLVDRLRRLLALVGITLH